MSFADSIRRHKEAGTLGKKAVPEDTLPTSSNKTPQFKPIEPKSLPERVAEIFISPRGYSKAALEAAQPSFKDKLVGSGKALGEIVLGVSSLTSAGLRQIPGLRQLAGKPEDLAKYEQALKPKTAEEAKVMRDFDIYSTILPVGGTIKGTEEGAWFVYKSVGGTQKATKAVEATPVTKPPTSQLATEAPPTALNQMSEIEKRREALMTEREILNDTLQNNPAKTLASKVGRGDNTLAQLQKNAELRGEGMTDLDSRITELGFRDLAEAEQALATYRAGKARLAQIDSELKTTNKTARVVKKDEAAELASLDEIAGQTPTMELATRNLVPPKPPKKPPRLTKKNLPEPGSARERGFVTSVKEAVPEAASRIRGEYIPRSTDELAVKAANLIKKDFREAERVLTEELGDKSVAVASEMVKHYNRLAQASTDILQKNLYYDKIAETTTKIAERLTEAGRTAQAAWILSRQTPEGQLRFLATEINKFNAKNPSKKIPGLSGEEAKSILEEAKRIFDMPEGEDKLRAFVEFQDKLRSRIPSKLMDKIISVWRAGLLTGIKTLGLNINSNLAHMVAEVSKDPAASMADIVMSWFTGKRSKGATLSGLSSGVKEGLKRGWTFWKTGYDPREISKAYEATRVHFKNPILQGYVDYVFRTVAAGDQPMYYGALRRSLAEQAQIVAKNEGLKGDELAKRIKFLEENPTEEMSAYATIDAETAVFLNQTSLGKLAKGVQDLGGGAGKLVVPFARTPSAVAMQVLNYSPAGVPLEIARQLRKGKFDQRMMANAFGRSVTGSVPLIWIGTELFDNDMISLDFPKTEREREQWKNEGRTPNSVKVDGKWQSLQAFGPLGPIVLYGAHFQNQLDETGSPTAATINAFGGTLKSFTESTFLRGVNDLLEALFGTSGSPQGYAAQFISSWIPAIINDVARTIDTNERVTSARTFAETVKNRIMARIPLLRENLEPQVDTLGREVPRTASSRVSSMINPFRPSDVRDTPVTIELRRLTDAGFNPSPTRPGDKFGYPVLSEEQNTKLWKRAGEITNTKIAGLIRDPRYAKLSDEEKAKTIEQFVTKSQVRARAEMVVELTRGLGGQALKQKLSELKAGKILTEPVFVEYKKLTGAQ